MTPAELTAEWERRAEELEQYAAGLRSTGGPITGPEGAQDAEAAALDYRLRAALLDEAGSLERYRAMRDALGMGA